MNLFDLKGRTALVTGSSRGIGRAIALTLAEAGAHVAIHYTGKEELARETAEAAAAFGVSTTVIQAELGQESSAKRLHEECLSAFGRLDILVLNASIQIPKPWLDISREDLESQVTVNFSSSFELIQLAAPGMVERGWGRILTIGSVQERKPNPEMIVYSSLKSAQTAMGLSLAKQLAPHGVTVNNLAPGVIDTDRYR
jgi:NAD(P)-dependent dehydrogenase (short-subunit alcohol dehydrogenase family)